MRYSEARIQLGLWHWLYNRGQRWACPNVCKVYDTGECDLLTIMRSGLACEYEIKVSHREYGETIWWPVEAKPECVRGMKCYREYENSEQWRMPYVYWLPIEDTCKAWVMKMLRVYFGLDPIPQKWLERNGQLRLFPRRTEPGALPFTEVSHV